MIKIIVATSKNGIIGNDNKLLWNISEDLKKFRDITIGGSVIMGRKTFESIGKPLDKRRNIVITRNLLYKADGCEIVSSLEEALSLTDNDCFIIGGGEIYKQAIEISDYIYLTLINEYFDGDTYFPVIDSTWNKISDSGIISDNNIYEYSFIEYIKKRE